MRLEYLVDIAQQHRHPTYRVVQTPSMPSLILVVFILQLIIHLISTFGGQTINDLVWPPIFESNITPKVLTAI